MLKEWVESLAENVAARNWQWEELEKLITWKRAGNSLRYQTHSSQNSRFLQEEWALVLKLAIWIHKPVTVSEGIRLAKYGAWWQEGHLVGAAQILGFLVMVE